MAIVSFLSDIEKDFLNVSKEFLFPDIRHQSKEYNVVKKDV